MGKIVQIAELSVYGDDDEILLEDLSFTLDREEVAQLPGFSNLQYEILFDVLTGNLSPDSGQVVLGDRNIVRLSPKNRKMMLREEVGFLPGHFVLPEKKTIIQSLEFKLKIADKNEDTQERISEVLELTNLRSVADISPREADEVDQVKAALAISIVTRPDILVCHKPFSSLDSKGIEEVINILIGIRDQKGLSVLLLSDKVPRDIKEVEVIESNLTGKVVN